jgi:hypothetical protein
MSQFAVIQGLNFVELPPNTEESPSPIGNNVYPLDDKHLWKPKGDRIAITISLDIFLLICLAITFFFERRMIAYLDQDELISLVEKKRVYQTTN